MHDMLIDQSKFLLLILLLILNNEVVKEYLIQLIQTFLNRKLDPLDRRCLVLIQRQFLGIIIL